MNTYLIMTAIPLGAYLLGAVPFGLLIVLGLTRTDIRQMGSGNIGATNVRRAAGTPWAVVALICDVLKGLLPTLAALLISNAQYQWLPAIAALSAVLGHMYPIYLRFKPSGKGVATTLGCLLVLAPWACLLIVLGFILSVYWSRRVSIGSITGALLLPPAAWFTTHDPAVTAVAVIMMVLILLRHKENFQRLAAGKEPTL